ncbi:hypothetical protein CBER1_10019 [Cercospora berteroae]|uniref:Uncharacterized protein n=1 Tax=Cercospora berteroae TaxID=357750 RepID=A0A2S6BXI1_9PEZI|nr:hypothetical protein CBER1_10019 [Cercospora berteroae]
MSDTTDQFLSHLGKWLCDLANDRPTESSRGWLRQLAEQHSYSALPWVRDGVEQIEREVLYLRKNEKVTDAQTVIDFKVALYNERQEHRAAMAQLCEALHKRQSVIDEAATENTKELLDKSQTLSAELQHHEAQSRLLIQERDAANAALQALQVEHDAVLEDLHDAKERRTAALHYTDQLQSILGVNLEAWHDSDSVAEDSVNGSNEDAAPADHCHSTGISPSSPSVAAPPTPDNGTHNSPLSPKRPNCSRQNIHLLSRRNQEYLQRIRDLETENEKLREELQLSAQLHAVTDAELSDFPDEPPQGTEEVVKSARQVEEQLQEENTAAQKAMTFDESSDESDQEEDVEAERGAWRAPRVIEGLERAFYWLNDWHKGNVYVSH